MPALVTCGDRDVQRGRISMGLRGTSWSELEIDGDVAPTGTVQIQAAGGLALTGTVVRAGVFLLNTHVIVIGGAGGLKREVVGAFQRAQLRDPLAAVLEASGEKQSSAIASDVLAVPLERYSLGRCTAALALDDLAKAATAHLGRVIGWRILPDATLWMGSEDWPTQELPSDAVIAEQFPVENRTVIGCATPALLPGVDLAGVGRVRGVDHWISPGRIRSHLWT